MENNICNRMAEFIQWINKWSNSFCCGIDEYNMINNSLQKYGLLNYIDTTDIVKVVRCKNCIHKCKIINEDGTSMCAYHDGMLVNQNDYCNFGETYYDK